jgi:hypothetical protein
MKTNQQKRVLIWTTVEVANVVPWSGGVRPHHIEAEDIVAVLLDDGTWMTVNAKDINWKHYTQAQSPGGAMSLPTAFPLCASLTPSSEL